MRRACAIKYFALRIFCAHYAHNSCTIYMYIATMLSNVIYIGLTHAFPNYVGKIYGYSSVCAPVTSICERAQ